MKIFFLLVLSMFAITLMQAQDISDNKDLIEAKAKNYKTASLVCGGLGIACIATSAVLSVSELNILGDDGPPTAKERTAGALGLIGFTSVLAGFGLHLASKSAKRKSKALSFQKEGILSLQNGKMNYKAVPTLSLHVTIGK